MEGSFCYTLGPANDRKQEPSQKDCTGYTPDHSTNIFTVEELNISIHSLANNKAPGIDIKIPTEVWKSGALNDQLQDVCKIMLEGGD